MHSRAVGVIAVFVVVLIAGCSRLRLPAVDYTGRRIFTPLPTTTGLALPCTSDECKLSNCFGLRCLGDPLNLNPFPLPEPAFTEPETPPPCLQPAPATTMPPPGAVIGGQSTEPCVPGAGCPADCISGPPAVLIGSECNANHRCKLPKRGKRGCILLSPQRIVAPVGGEVVLLSGICGDGGYLQLGEPLEWMLTPESVGTFIQVGDDDPGLVHRFARIKRASKQDPSYALGVTSTKRMKITRGNLNAADDVQLEKGQTWITVSSPSEGTSKVTVLAPESECWDQRKATSTIYWIDAARQFPGPQTVPAGTPVTLNTRVTRSEGTLPAAGWKVIYEVVPTDMATFANSGIPNQFEAVVDDSGNATAQLVPVPGTSGTAIVNMSVVRPGGVTDNMPPLKVFTGQTTVTWTAAQLGIEVGAPQIASFRQPFQAFAKVFNPGNRVATNVIVRLQVPPTVRATTDDPGTSEAPGTIIWNVGDLPPQTQKDLSVTITTDASLPLLFEARADGDLVASDSTTVDVYRPSLALSVAPEKETYEVGETARFVVDVRNIGDRPLEDLVLFAEPGPGMIHQSNEPRLRLAKPDGPLQTGETWQEVIDLTPTDSGRRCVSLEAIASAGQQKNAEACITVTNRPPPTPALSAKLAGKAALRVGDVEIFRGVVINTGRIPLDNVRVTMAYDPQLTPAGATRDDLVDSRTDQFLIEWLIPRLEPETSRTLEGQFRAIGQNPRSTIVLAAQSDQGARTSERFVFQILPSTAPPPAQPQPSPPQSLPPTVPPPGIPGAQPPPRPVQPPPTQPGPTGPGPNDPTLGLNLRGPQGPVLVNEPISYQLSIQNNSDRPDGNIAIRISQPPGIVIRRAVPVLYPDLGGIEKVEREPGSDLEWVMLKGIGTLRPGEAIDYEIVMVANRAQRFEIRAEAVSELMDRIGKKSVSSWPTEVVQGP